MKRHVDFITLLTRLKCLSIIEKLFQTSNVCSNIHHVMNVVKIRLSVELREEVKWYMVAISELTLISRKDANIRDELDTVGLLLRLLSLQTSLLTIY